ncbi:prepilin-type N-terminal cleavage/methylation domain-containing protein [Melittangium boletus]|uniref:prepilin-type N-terminal cleavage/methylation domain-containing protein n=1 Tax=Melittangium boletus TaxID=83453 RepID=UPI003DA60E91
MKRFVMRRGFTLLEVMIAVAITALMGAMVSMAFQTGFHAKEVVEEEADHYRMLRAAMNRMAREIGSAYVSDRYDLSRFRDQNDRPSNFIGESDKLTFTTFAHQRLYADVKESDQAVVEYSIQTSTEQGARGRTDLIRRADPNVGDRMDRGGTTDVLFEGAKKIEFAYWDSQRKEWEDEWDTRRTEKKSILPTRVRITLTTLDENGKEVRYTTQTRVMLNTELPRF